jgi:MFS family permease
MAESSNTFKLGFAVRSLRHRNYRLFFGGQSLSLIGTWMTQVASSWLVYRLTNSALLLGLVSFSGQLPALLLTPFAGVWVDRWDRRTVLKVTQVLAMLESFALALLVFSGHVNIWYILGLTMFQGVVNAFDIPARQTFVVEMLEDRADLPNAIALNSSMMNGARLIGPSIAGAVIAVGGERGEGYCFLIDGVSYIAVIASLMLMNTKPGIARIHENLFSELKAGWRYVIGYDPIRSILALIAFISLVGLPYSVLLPVFAREILRGGPNTFGLLTGATGMGAFISAILLAMRKSIVGLGKRMAITSLTFGAALIAFAFSQVFWLSMLLMLLVGFSMMQVIASGNTILQTIVDEDKRGRVMSFYTLAFIGAAPIGSLVAGALANQIGAVPTVVVCGLLCIIASLWFFGRLENIRKIVRPLYVERGILP